jgi:A/G-specific adenine glycosylase
LDIFGILTQNEKGKMQNMSHLGFLLPDASWRRAFRRRLLGWYDKHARDLPWRRTRDPYAIWLSEIMLQQTQVGTVVGYFDRFLKAFPTIQALAGAKEQDVLRLWEGLGYYRRARQLHKAAKALVAEHGGGFPCDPEVVRRLPGIGRYTAGAILSIAFDLPEPILEANTLRLLSRLLGYDGDPRSSEGQRLLWAMAEAVLPRRGAGQLNQALMELGSEVCKLRLPDCEACRVASLCRAREQGSQEEIPRPKAKPRIEAVREAAVIVRHRGRVLLVRWPEGRRWAGLWDFPRFALRETEQVAVGRELCENVRALTGAVISPGRCLHTLSHGVTRFRITLQCHEARFVSQNGRGDAAIETRWLRPSELGRFPLSSTGRKLAGFC